jgi:periplasmic copper chaperone A
MVRGYDKPNWIDPNMRFLRAVTLLLSIGTAVPAAAAGQLVVENAWIRTAPPGAPMLAGYARLRNAGDAPLIVIGAESAQFADVSLHRSVEENGVEHMRALGPLTIAPGASVDFTPGDRHFMLMGAKSPLAPGARVKIHIDTESGAGATADFVVRDAP